MIESPLAPSPSADPTRILPPEPAPRRYPERITVKSGDSFIFLRCAEIDWISAQGDYVKFHFGSRGCLVRMTMNGLEGVIDPARFLRIHRSSFVNVDRVEKISPLRDGNYAVVLRDGLRLRIGRSYRARVRAIYGASTAALRLEDWLLAGPAGR